MADPLDDKVYKWIRMVKIHSTGKTGKWVVENHVMGSSIGYVAWHGAWRQYCFFPNANTVFSGGCISDVADFLRRLMEARKSAPVEQAPQGWRESKPVKSDTDASDEQAPKGGT